MSENPKHDVTTDVVLVGAGIMSATLGALLKLMEPNWSITVVERLDVGRRRAATRGTTPVPATRRCAS